MFWYCCGAALASVCFLSWLVRLAMLNVYVILPSSICVSCVTRCLFGRMFSSKPVCVKQKLNGGWLGLARSVCRTPLGNVRIKSPSIRVRHRDSSAPTKTAETFSTNATARVMATVGAEWCTAPWKPVRAGGGGPVRLYKFFQKHFLH